MKTEPKTCLIASLLIFAAFSFVGCRSTPNQESMKCLVVRLLGNARASSDGGKYWTAVNLGDSIPSGSLVQTAERSEIYVSIGETIRPIAPYTSRGAPFDPVLRPSNLLRLSQNTLLEIPKAVKFTDSKKREDEQILLKLYTGELLGCVKGTETSYEIKTTNGIARMKTNAVYRMRGSGLFKMILGSAEIRCNGVSTLNLFSLQGIDFETGRQFQLPPLDENWRHDIWLPSEPGYIHWANLPGHVLEPPHHK